MQLFFSERPTCSYSYSAEHSLLAGSIQSWFAQNPTRALINLLNSDADYLYRITAGALALMVAAGLLILTQLTLHSFLESPGSTAPSARSLSSTIQNLNALIVSPLQASYYSVRSMHAYRQIVTIGRCLIESVCINDLVITSVSVYRAISKREVSWRNSWRRFSQSCMHRCSLLHKRLVSLSVLSMQDTRLSRLAGAPIYLCALITPLSEACLVRRVF